MKEILVIDDDLNLLKVIETRLLTEGYAVETAKDNDQALKLVMQKTFDAALIDLRLAGTNGLEVMEEMRRLRSEIPVIIITAHGSIESAVDAMKKGAFSYITKPFDYHELLLQIENCLETCRLSNEVKRLQKIVKDNYGFDNIIGKSDNLRKVLDRAALAAEVDSTVHIYGESGTGKELIAKNLHLTSMRSEGPYIALNCAAIPENLFESELFGYVKGAFTGAQRSRKGLLEQAHGGCLFLDEISEMPFSMQSKLLRILDEMEFYPLGGRKTVKVDARIITASNKKLEEEVMAGRFRGDLFYRVNVISIIIPPLRERTEDIPLLARFFLDKYNEKLNKDIKGFASEAIQKLMLHTWSGNVRELENTIESAVAMSTDDILTDDLILRNDQSGNGDLKSFKVAKDDFEKKYLISLLELTNGNISRAAKLAGKNMADLYYLLTEHNLDPNNFR
ncbi:sigma-54-dependent transcriptional regulator [Thermodesulfobacteriota bacterium]